LFQVGRHFHGHDEYERVELHENVAQLLSNLEEREQTIIKLRFGFGMEKEEDCYPHTLEECSQQLHITRKRVRQIERKTLGKLKTFALPLKSWVSDEDYHDNGNHDKLAKVTTLRDYGVTYKDIAQSFNVSTQTISNIPPFITFKICICYDGNLPK